MPKLGRKQRIPVRCSLCTSRNQPEGKIIDAVTTKRKDVLFFLNQHCSTMQHQRRLALHESLRPPAARNGPMPPPEPVPCEGVSLDDKSGGRLNVLQKHVKLWISWQAPSELRKHSYTFCSASQTFTLRHANCQAKCTTSRAGRATCGECLKLTEANSIRRVVVKFVLKKFAAEHLQARLYHSDQKLKDVEAEIKADEIYLFHQAPFDRIINFRTHELQMWVRMSFHSISVNRRSEPFHSFVQTVVDPCMRVNVTSALQTRPQLLQAQVLFQEFLQNGDASVMDRVNAEIASATINGKLQHHPLLQGLTMSCLKMLDRQEKGLNMTGRNAATSIQATEEGRMLVQEAGATLAILGCNKEILKRFGQNSATRSVFEDMRAHSLPTPRLALATPTQVQENLQLIDHHLSATTMTSGCISNVVFVCFCMFLMFL